MRWLRRILGKWRLWLGFCPACNSDAPAVDTCPVCKAWEVNNWRREFPPSAEWKALMWRNFELALIRRDQ